MTPQITIVLIIFLLFIALILSGKVKIHVAAMMIPIALEITGVLDFKAAWGGMLNSSIVMMAAMFVVGAAVGKTSIVSRLSKTLIKGESSDFKIMLGISVPIILLSCVVNATAIMTIMIPMIVGICAEQKRPLSKFVFASACLAQLWAGFIMVMLIWLYTRKGGIKTLVWTDLFPSAETRAAIWPRTPSWRTWAEPEHLPILPI